MEGVGRICNENVKAEIELVFFVDMCYTVLFNVQHNLNNFRSNILNIISTINHTVSPPWECTC